MLAGVMRGIRALRETAIGGVGQMAVATLKQGEEAPGARASSRDGGVASVQAAAEGVGLQLRLAAPTWSRGMKPAPS